MFRKKILTAVAALGIAACAWAGEAPKYVFYFIGDGMGMAQAMAAQAYGRTVLGNDSLLLMMRFPVASMATTYSASSPVTDSAASGTALATGHKTKNGMLGMDPDTVAVTSIARELFDRGYGVALVTSVPPDDATPGAFYAHVPKRSMYYEVGCEAAACGYDFIGGSNLRGLKDKSGNPTDLLERFAANGVGIAHGIEGLDAVSDSARVLLLNPESIDYHQIHFTIDSVPGALTLPAMTRAALERLQRNGRDRFFMMVEGGNIDYGGHANDGGAIIKEVINFNEALREAYDWYLAHPDETLIVVTADHETGGLALGNNDMGYKLALKYIDSQRMSKDMFAEWCRALRKTRQVFTWDDMKDFLTEKFGFWTQVPLTGEQTARLEQEFVNSMKNGNVKDKKTLYNSFNGFTEAVFRIIDSHTGLGFTTNGHSGGLVPVYAIGVGAGEFAPLNDNALIPEKMRRILGIQ